ncbi:hypothetical protein BH23PLA1_BH23PLA1_26320 [soil metagenome]
MSRASQQPAPAPPADVLYPSTDGEPMGESTWHIWALVHLLEGLRDHFAGRDDVLVAGDLFLYYKEGSPKHSKAPDCMVVFGVGNHHRPSFKTWEEGAVPAVVIEITSEDTYKEDLHRKGKVYADIGVEEFYLFDPQQVRLDRPLLGFQLGEEHGFPDYIQREAEPDGGLDSSALGLRLVPEGTTLRLINLQTGQPLLTGLEKNLALQEEARRLDEERQRREEEQRLRVEEQRLRQEEQRRAEELAAEVDRLRALLNQRDAETESAGD